MKSCVVLLSGGMDSATLLALVHGQAEKVAALSVDYAQRHRKELQCAKRIAEFFDVRHEILDISNINHLLAGSSLTTSEIPVPHGHYEDESMKVTVVPGRNTILLSIAAGWAASMKFDTVAYAAHAGDHAIYPDCRPDYVASMQALLRFFHYDPVSLYTPFLTMSKADILRVGLPLQVPYELTWTCYEGQDRACGLCGSCRERLEAFRQVGVDDPIRYTIGI